MAQKLKVLELPDTRLRHVAKPIEKVDKEIQKLMENMLETMYAHKGIGLAAIQVGIPKRVCVIDLGLEDEDIQYFMANPEIVEINGEEVESSEGCLSIPEEYDLVIRNDNITVKYLDYNNKEQTLKAEGLLAFCIQHEIDHLNGKLFIDRLSRLKRDIILRKFNKRK